MKRFPILCAVLALVVVLGLAGCGGDSPGLNPTVTFTFEDGTTLPSVGASEVLLIKGEAKSADEAGNPITSIQWSQSPALGTFSSPKTLETSWQVTNPAAITAQTPVTLTVEVETLRGGRTSKTLNLLVQPAAP